MVDRRGNFFYFIDGNDDGNGKLLWYAEGFQRYFSNWAFRTQGQGLINYDYY